MSATTNSTLRKKESDAENNAPHATFTRVVGVLFIVPIERNEEGGKKKLILATLPLHIRMESTRVVSLKTGRGKPYYSP